MKKALFLSTILSISMALPAMANSAQTHFEGISPAGTLFTGKQSPLVVEQEVLTFDLQEFPESHYRELEEYLSYDGKVTAEYTFHNPSDADITVEMAFPFGRTPDYGFTYDAQTGERFYAADAEKYDVMLDGVPIEKMTRHTLAYYGDGFGLEKDIALLQDGFQKDGFFRPDLPVTKYTWHIEDIDAEYTSARAGFVWKDNGETTRLLLQEQLGGTTTEESITVQCWVENDGEVVLYAFGEPLKKELKWFYENGMEDERFACTQTFVSAETLTFEEYALAQEHTGILDYDWYNALVGHLNANLLDFGVIGSEVHSVLDPARDLMRWYAYEMTVPAGETIVNTVAAPMYPDVNVWYQPPVFDYTYLLSPAKTWADFGKLDIIVNTPYYMTDSDFAFEKTETGYRTSLDGLPEGELSFTLCADEAPQRESSGISSDIFGIIVGLIFGILRIGGMLVAAVVVVIIVVIFVKRKKKNQK